MAAVTLAQSVLEENRTEQEIALIAGWDALQAVKVALGDKDADNAREHLTNKLVLMMAEQMFPDDPNTIELRRAFDIVETSSVRDVILAG